MKNLVKNLICTFIFCLFIANVLFNTDINLSKDNTPTETCTEDYEPEVSIEKNDTPMVGSSLEQDPNIDIPPEMGKDEYEVKYGKIKEEEVGCNDHGDIACASLDLKPYPGYYTMYMDLRNRENISVDQMNDLIDHWLRGRESKLKNQGEAFIKASQETSLDPIFLLALAANEGGWTVSPLHASKNNPYSINMVDTNPSQGYNLGDEYGEGIINGAKWIKKHYYDNGQNTLYSMIYGAKEYSSSKDKWIGDILYIMEKSYNYILNK